MIEFTKEQQSVIDARKRDILVSAAAGSGKTAVLVERIIKRLLDEKHPVDIDHMLVVTFTRAAAKEMKEKIRVALDERLKEHPGDAHLKKQATYVFHSQITTIDSFCNYLVKNYFYTIGIEPDFRIISSNEYALMETEIIDALFKECYEKKEEGFLRLVDLTNMIVQGYVTQISQIYSPKSVKNIYSLFLAAITYVDPTLHFRVVLPQKKIRETTVPTDQEVQALINAANRDLKVAICLAAFGTLRAGEVCGLTYGDLDPKTRFIHVHRDIVHDEYGQWVLKESPKNDSSNRYVELPQEVIDLIGTGDPGQRIVPVVPNTITNSFCRLRQRCGVNIRFHDLRHYSASIMHAIGIPDQYIMDRGGWKTDGTLKAIYRNVLQDKKNDFIDRTNKYFSENFKINA